MDAMEGKNLVGRLIILKYTMNNKRAVLCTRLKCQDVIATVRADLHARKNLKAPNQELWHTKTQENKSVKKLALNTPEPHVLSY